MMKTFGTFSLIAVSILAAATAHAAGPANPLRRTAAESRSVSAKATPLLDFVPSYLCPCPEPYCDKPLPAPVCLPPAKCCDDYCKKPLPWWCRPSACCPDDYCPKPEPRCLPPLPCPGCAR